MQSKAIKKAREKYRTPGASSVKEIDNKLISSYHLESNFDKILTVKEGVSKKFLTDWKQYINIDYDHLSAILGTTKTTIHKKQNDEKFSLSISEKMVSLVDLYIYGYEVFEDKERFEKWVQTNNRALGNKMPLDLMDTIFGIDEVKDLIGRIEHGVYS